MGGLIIANSGSGRVNVQILDSNNTISGGTFSASGTSSISVKMNSRNTMTGVTITTSGSANC